jgi:hypothetical protein
VAPRKATAAKKTAPAKKAAPKKAAASKDVTAPVAAALDGAGYVNFLTELKALVERHLSSAQSGTSPDVLATATDEPSTPQTREEREEEISGWSLAQLRAALIAATDEDGDTVFEEKEIKAEKDKDTLIGALLSYEFDDEDEDDEEDDEEDEDEEDEDEEDTEEDEDEEGDEEDDEEDDDEDDEEEEDEELTRADILKLSLADAKKLAKEQFGKKATELKGLDIDGIADLILGEDEDEDEEGEEEGEEEFWTLDELMELKIAEVRAICDENGIKYTTEQGKNKELLAKKIVNA